MANILYEPNDFTIVDVIETAHQELNEDVYTSLKGKSILNLIHPAYLAKFLSDHNVSFHTQESSVNSYQFIIGDKTTFCDVQFQNANRQNEYGAFQCSPSLLANLVSKVKKNLLPQILQDSRLTVLVSEAGNVFHCPTMRGLFVEYLSEDQLLGKQLFDVLKVTDLHSGKHFTLEVLLKNLNEQVQALFRIADDKVVALTIKTTKVEYADATFYCVAFDTIAQPENDISSPFILELFDAKIQQAIIVTDMKGQIQFWNQHATTLYGWAKDEVIGKNVMNTIPVEQSLEEAQEIMLQLKNGLSWSGIFLAQNKSGDSLYVQVHDSPILDEEGNLVGIIGVSWDVTDQEKERSTYKLLQKLLNNTSEGIIAVYPSGVVAYANIYVKSLFNLKDVVAQSITLDQLFKDRSEDILLLNGLRGLQDGKSFVFEGALKVSTDKRIQFRIDGRPVFHENGQLAGVTLFIEDISERVALRNLHQSEVLNREALINGTQDWIWSVDSNYCLITANNALLNNLEGYFGKRVASGTNLLDKSIFDKEYISYWKSIYDQALSGQSIIEEFAAPTPEGEYGHVYAAVTLNPIFNNQGEIVGCACYGRDITKEKKAIIQLQTSEKRFSTIFSSAPLGIAIIDSYTGKIEELNQPFADIAGRSITEMKQISWMEITHPDDITEDQENMQLMNEKKISGFTMEKRYIRPDGSYVWINMAIKPIDFEQYANPHHLCMIEDITNKKNDHEAVRISNERYEIAVKATNDMIWDWDVQNDHVYRNAEHFVRLTGLPESQKDANGEFWYTRVHPDDLSLLKKTIQEVADQKGKNTFDEIYRFIKADNSIAYFNDRGYAIKDEAGNLIRVIGSVTDITEKKQYEEELERLSLVAKKTSNAVIVTDVKGHAIWVNEAFEHISGYKANEIIGKIPGEILQGVDTDPDIKLFMSHRIKQRKPFECEILNYHKNGNAYWIYLQAQPVFNENGDLKYYFAIQSDITAEKNAQEELKRSELKYRQLFDSSPVSIVIWNPETMLIEEVNEKAVEDYGIERHKLIGSNYLNLHDQKSKSSILDLADKVSIDNNFYHHAVYACKGKQAQTLFMQVSFHRIDYDGRMSVMAIGNNITEQVLLESALTDERRRKQDELTMAVLSAQDRERTNLGQELHDNVNQLLSVAKMYLSLSRKQDSQFGDHIQMVDNAITEAIADIRNISHELILPRFTEGDFGGFLDELFKRFSSASKIPVELQFQDSTIQGVSESQLLAIYRILQEQLNNVIKYAKANTVFVDFKRRGQDLFIELKDDGVGFNMDANWKGGVGFANMRTRASMNSGTINVDAAEGKGCTLQLHFVIKA